MAERRTECQATKGFTRETLAEYPVENLGLPHVTLVDAATERRCKACGAQHEIEIPNAQGLMAAVALARVVDQTKLDAEAIRFLQNALGLPAQELAERLGVRAETMSRWQNGKEPIGPASEKVLRVLVGVRLAKDAPAIEFSARAVLETKSHPFRQPPAIRLHLVRTPKKKAKSWELEAA